MVVNEVVMAIGINSQEVKVQMQVKPEGMVCGQEGFVLEIDDDSE